MRVGRRRREEAEVEASSMNDIMFFLMLFFLIASTLANPNVINIMLPKASTTTQMETKTLPLTVRIENKGTDNEELGIYIEQDRVAFDDLDDILTEEKEKAGVSDEGKSLLNVVLRLDKDLKVQDMVDVMQVGANLGIKMVLATDKTSK
ncbi:MAG: biopolymer transporter ExbD [Bacteroidetes bacterium]|nr:biopolymer transporter ExbD [Bacteroidota bacterium]